MFDAIERELFGTSHARDTPKTAELRGQLREKYRVARALRDGDRIAKAGSAHHARLFGVPATVPNFTGRVTEVAFIESTFSQDIGTDNYAARVALTGMPGVGKTVLAIAYAHHIRHGYTGIWWCPAATRPGLLLSLAAFAAELGVGAANSTEIEKSAKAALEAVAGAPGKWLLIYDNAASPERIADLLPDPAAHVLITSRSSNWLGFAHEIAITPFSNGEAMTFLQNMSGIIEP
jgi:hypothetical protein